MSEFQLDPMDGAIGSDIPYNIDGDPFPSQPIHVRILNKRLRVFGPNDHLPTVASPQRSVKNDEDFADDITSFGSFTLKSYSSNDLPVLGKLGPVSNKELIGSPAAWAMFWDASRPWASLSLRRFYLRAEVLNWNEEWEARKRQGIEIKIATIDMHGVESFFFFFFFFSSLSFFLSFFFLKHRIHYVSFSRRCVLPVPLE